MPVASPIVRQLLRHDYPFLQRDFPTAMISKVTECDCGTGEHSFTTVSVDEQDQMTLERRKCVCTGCSECEAREVRVIPHAASEHHHHADPLVMG
jgi:hypothetical protein